MTLTTLVMPLVLAAASQGASAPTGQDYGCPNERVDPVTIVIERGHVEGTATIPNTVVPVCPKGRVIWTFLNDSGEEIDVTVHKFKDVTDPSNEKGADHKVKFPKDKKNVKVKPGGQEAPGSGLVPARLDGDEGTCLKYTINVRGEKTKKPVDHDPRLQLTDPIRELPPTASPRAVANTTCK